MSSMYRIPPSFLILLAILAIPSIVIALIQSAEHADECAHARAAGQSEIHTIAGRLNCN